MKTPRDRLVDKMRKFYSEHPEVSEGLDPDRKGRVVDVEDDGVVRVRWAGTERVGTHTEDELITPRLTKLHRQELPGVVDAFSDVRPFLGSDANDDSDDRQIEARDWR